MRRGRTYPQSTVGYNGFQKVYETTLGMAASSITISGLNGNTDVEYMMESRIIRDGAGADVLRLNNDSTANIYGYQCLSAGSTTLYPSRTPDNCLIGLSSELAATVAYAKVHIYAKSGFTRTATAIQVHRINGTTVTYTALWGLVYNQTSNNITSMTITASANNMDVGTYLALYAKRART